jgi:hypothetical protein
MVIKNETRSLAEVIMQGDGRYDELIGVDKLRDGTYLVYEKTKLFGPWEGFARVHRLDPNKREELSSAITSYQQHEDDYTIIRKLNDVILPIKR